MDEEKLLNIILQLQHNVAQIQHDVIAKLVNVQQVNRSQKRSINNLSETVKNQRAELRRLKEELATASDHVPYVIPEELYTEKQPTGGQLADRRTNQEILESIQQKKNQDANRAIDTILKYKKMAEEQKPQETYTATEHAITCRCGAITLHPPHLISVVCPSCNVRLEMAKHTKPNFTAMFDKDPHLYCQCEVCREHRK